MSNCIHGLTSESCSLCNGLQWKRKYSKKQEDPEVALAREEYESIKDKIKNHGEPWTETDSEVLYEHMSKVPLEKHSTRFRKAVYKAAKELNRSFMSVVWHTKYMFENPENQNRNEWKFRQQIEQGAVLC